MVHQVGVPAEWLERGYTLELELPRNLACAACEGGGCDACGRAGAISLRGRNEPTELVEVTLPGATPEVGEPARGVMLRLPGYGGFSEQEPELPRGNLLLRIVPAAEPDPGVRHAHPTERPPAGATASEQDSSPSKPAVPRAAILVAVVILWILFLIFLRMGGVL